MMAAKYGNKKARVDGHKFDSIAESKYYEQLKWILLSEQITSFKLRPQYLLQDSFKKNGVTFWKIECIADVYVIKNNDKVPILIIERKSNNKLLIDDVFSQVYKYDDVLFDNTVAITNGVELLLKHGMKNQMVTFR
ncbi:MAG TPA: DUF1064 domain-containing protein [Ureibacillus sp.]|nr:DUF1064 domain-containing protein [Ureibacillus sp.]